MRKLVLMDGNSIAFRAFYALPLLTSSTGLYTNAVYGFTMILLKLLEEEKPTHMLVAFDAGKTTFRTEQYSEYKAGRSKTPGELSEQFPLIKEVLDAFGIAHTQVNHYEADDIIGTLAQVSKAQGIDTQIVSGDKDLLQLVDKQVHVLLTRKGVSEVERYGIEEIQEKYGLTPHQIIDLKGLMGDASDNIPGIPGVGEKTALKLLHQYPTVEEVIAHVDELPGKKLQERVREHRDQALMSKELATICLEAPVETSLEWTELKERDEAKIEACFRRLEFRKLLERFGVKEDETPVASLEAISFVAVHPGNVAYFTAFLEQEEIALFAEASLEHPCRAELSGLGLSDGIRHYFVPKEQLQQPALIQWLADSKRKKIVMDSKRMQVILANHGLDIQGIGFDVQLAAYLLNPSESQLELPDMVKKYLEITIPVDIATAEIQTEWVVQKANLIHQLYPILQQQIQDAELASLLMDCELPLSNVLAKMEQRGIQVDEARLVELGVELKAKMDQLTATIYQLAGTEFNLNSPKQLGEILYDKLSLPVLKKTKTGYSTSADVLEKLAPQHEIVESILHYRQVGKLYSTYAEGLRKEITADHKIHTCFHQTITATGRLSSTEPNLQNIPIKLEEGRRIRQVFIPSVPNWKLVSADYSQVELRVLAHLSSDPNLRRAFNEDKDIHTQTAMDIFGVDEEAVTSLMRRTAKAVNFGIVYGMSDYGLSQNLNISRQEAKAFIDRYFATYPGVKEYMDTAIQEARDKGYVTTLLHRRRYLPDIHSKNFNLRSFAERMAMNTPIQGTAADIIKYAMIQIDQRLEKENWQSRMLLQVHDELIFEAPMEELASLKEMIVTMMEGAVPLDVPLRVDVSEGANWYEAK